MRLQEYLRSKETVYCQTECKIQDHSKWVSIEEEGELAVTDSRVAFSKGKRVVDLDPSKIHKIEFVPKRIPWFYVLYALSGLIVIPGGFIVEDILGDLLGSSLPIAGFGVFVAFVLFVTGALSAYQRYNATLTIYSGKEKYVFRGRDLETVPHAIRGVS